MGKQAEIQVQVPAKLDAKQLDALAYAIRDTNLSWKDKEIVAEAIAVHLGVSDVERFLLGVSPTEATYR